MDGLGNSSQGNLRPFWKEPGFFNAVSLTTQEGGLLHPPEAASRYSVAWANEAISADQTGGSNRTPQHAAYRHSLRIVLLLSANILPHTHADALAPNSPNPHVDDNDRVMH